MSYAKVRQVSLGVIGCAIVVLVVSITAKVGFAIINKDTERNSVKAGRIVSPPEVTNPQPTGTMPAPARTNKPYLLKIKEWGVSIPLPESLKDAYYVVSTSSAAPDGSPNTIWLGLKSIEKCAAENANKGGKALATIIRTGLEDVEPVSGKRYTETYPNGATIDNYYYGFSTWSVDNDCTTVENLKKVDDAFKAAVKDLKKGE